MIVGLQKTVQFGCKLLNIVKLNRLILATVWGLGLLEMLLGVLEHGTALQSFKVCFNCPQFFIFVIPCCNKGKLWLMGGTPLNNEVWRLNNATKYRRREPLTRSHYTNYTYALYWEFMGNVGFFGVFYFHLSFDVLYFYLGTLVTSSRYGTNFTMVLQYVQSRNHQEQS